MANLDLHILYYLLLAHYLYQLIHIFLNYGTLFLNCRRLTRGSKSLNLNFYSLHRSEKFKKRIVDNQLSSKLTWSTLLIFQVMFLANSHIDPVVFLSMWDYTLQIWNKKLTLFNLGTAFVSAPLELFFKHSILTRNY